MIGQNENYKFHSIRRKQRYWLGMEKVYCKAHDRECMLKTGVKEGPNKGKSFYVCIDKQGCDFTQVASIPASHCLHHPDSMVELQAISHNPKQAIHRLYYRCVSGKKEGLKWCGNVPWTEGERDRRSPLVSRQMQPSVLPPVRNPFKASEKSGQESEWRRIQSGAADGMRGRREEQDEGGRTGRGGSSSDEEDGGENVESYRGKALPAGMKIKKRGSDKKGCSADGEKTRTMTTEVEPKDKRCDGEGKKERIRSGSTYNVETPSPNSQNPLGDLPQPPLGLISAAGSKVNSVDSSSPRLTDPPRSALPTTGEKPNRSPDPAPKDPREDPQPARSETTNPLTSCHSPRGEEEEAEDDDDDDDVQIVSVKPGKQTTSPPLALVQKTLTAFPGFKAAPQVKGQPDDPRGLQNLLLNQLQQKKATLSVVNLSALPDKGERLKSQVKELEDSLNSLSLTVASQPEPQEEASSDVKPSSGGHHPPKLFSRVGGTILLPGPGPYQQQATGGGLELGLSQGSGQMFGANSKAQAFYGGRMTETRGIAVKNATNEAIDHLHRSLETCPGPEQEVPDPRGIKVPLMTHQRQALAWLLWRENQMPCGGIMADDMGLGKTLTMIALILALKKKPKEGEKEDKKVENWFSKNDPSLVVSKATLVICPASLVHHWKKEIERHVKTDRLSVYLYHGPNRQKNAALLASHDVVVTTYSLVSKEIPVAKDGPGHHTKDSEYTVCASAPLLSVAWDRVILDEAHNIKNPKVQTSMAVCRLRARARWAVTGTPIQNNLLDMYSLLKFLRCAPFDEFKLWKFQVDNGSKRGGERLNILTQSLLLRRTKHQADSSGKPLVSLPSRTCLVHRLTLSKEEQSVYDVVFAQSRSTLQNYLQRHEGRAMDKAHANAPNPFNKVAQEFGVSQSDPKAPITQKPQQGSSTIHILSLLLRLRQCCSHLSLLKKTLDATELEGDGVVLSLEEQLNALSLSTGTPSSSGPGSEDTVSLNGSRFPSCLFEDPSKSTKISALVSELKAIRKSDPDQKSVIVSQWTSMLKIVAVHLKTLGLKYAVIDGTVPPKNRMDLVEDFNTNPIGPQVMLVSLCAGGVGLNLIGGNHLFLIDMHWNPALEDQACDRIYRVGQRRDVTIHRFVCEGTVEDKIATLQEKKKELAQKVLSGTGSTFTKLSLADLRVIFGV
ncbi:transcription termination factor 2 [Gadus morhua]|uniref:Transcription termination factor 2 n=1 Tax=Gadus morhua TaxID=8049 RepID=A0A8C5CM38_GADMO|nr:transcription termination factor 2 [Gadus morhua]